LIGRKIFNQFRTREILLLWTVRCNIHLFWRRLMFVRNLFDRGRKELIFLEIATSSRKTMSHTITKSFFIYPMLCSVCGMGLKGRLTPHLRGTPSLSSPVLQFCLPRSSHRAQI
jgi:hypothetical protein